MKGITLIGMPGSGKSTIGKMLAENLGWRFVDLDMYMKERTGSAHSDILSEKGDREFIKLEGELVLELDFKNLVFSPGGSIIYSPEAMEKLKKNTKIIYLRLPLEEIRKRLGRNIDSRGIIGLQQKGLEKLYDERTPLYKNFSDAIIDCEGLCTHAIVTLLAKEI